MAALGRDEIASNPSLQFSFHEVRDDAHAGFAVVEAGNLLSNAENLHVIAHADRELRAIR